jgi:hypothetical protein
MNAPALALVLAVATATAGPCRDPLSPCELGLLRAAETWRARAEGCALAPSAPSAPAVAMAPHPDPGPSPWAIVGALVGAVGAGALLGLALSR